MSQRKMTQYFSSQFMRPPAFESDSDEAPDPFAYVPLSQTKKSSRKRKTSSASVSCTYARRRAKRAKEAAKSQDVKGVKKSSPVAGPSQRKVLQTETGNPVKESDKTSPGPEDDDPSPFSESVLKVDAEKRPSDGTFLRAWDDIDGLNDGQDFPMGGPTNEDSADAHEKPSHEGGAESGVHEETDQVEESPKAGSGEKKSAEPDTDVEKGSKKDQESPKPGPSNHRQAKEGLSLSSEELASRVPMDGEEGVKSPIKVTLCERHPGKVLLSLRVEPEMALLPGQGPPIQ